MKQELKANIKLTIQADNTIEMRNVINHLKQIIGNNLDERLTLINTDSITVKPTDGKRRTIRVDQAARNLVDAMYCNRCLLWKPDFSGTVEAVILNREVINDRKTVAEFHGINLELAILMEKLGIETDF